MSALVEGPEGPASFTRQGPTRERTFSMLARDPEDVKTQLAAIGIFRGAVYQNGTTGFVPDPNLVALDIADIRPRSAVSASGTALYDVNVPYGYAVSSIRTSRPQLPSMEVQWRIRYSEDREPADIDRQGNPITNAAGEPIDPPLTRRVTKRAAVGVWHRWGTDVLSVQAPKDQYAGLLNRFEYLGAPPRCLRVSGGVEVDELNIAHPAGLGQFLFRLTVVLEFEPGKSLGTPPVFYPGWDDVFLNRGLRIKTTDPAKPFVQLRENQADLTTPRHVQVMLIDPTGFAALANNAVPNYRKAEHYDDIDFSGLTT